jgi:hypothetical protein
MTRFLNLFIMFFKTTVLFYGNLLKIDARLRPGLESLTGEMIFEQFDNNFAFDKSFQVRRSLFILKKHWS